MEAASRDLGSQSTGQRAVILTAHPIESKAVREYLDNLTQDTYQGTIYERGTFLARGGGWEIAIVEVGGESTTIEEEALRALEYLKPEIFLSIGVAAGIREVSLGDVVVANVVYGYGPDSFGSQGDPSQPETFRSSEPLVILARSLARKSGWLRRVQNRRSLPNSSPKVFIGPLITATHVVNSLSELDQYPVPPTFPIPLAVEMEGQGFLQAASRYGRGGSLFIRGISDLIKQRKGDNESDLLIAARLASAFAFELLANAEDVLSTLSNRDTSAGSESSNSPAGDSSDQRGSVPPSTQQEPPFPVQNSAAQDGRSNFTTTTRQESPPPTPPSPTAPSSESSGTLALNASEAPVAPDPATLSTAASELTSVAENAISGSTDPTSPIVSPADAPTPLSSPAPAAPQPAPPVVKDGMKPEDEEKSARDDKPVEHIEDDRLGHKLYAEALRDFITAKDTTTPLSISINGPWGSGKTSMMKMLQNLLEPPDTNLRAFLWQGFTWHLTYWGTFPALLWSRFLLRFGSVKTQENIKKGLAYKADDQNKQDSNQLDDGQLRWARMAKKKQPMPAPFQPTVWFNAWKFSQEEQIWAALATEVVNQLQAKYPWPLRLLFWLKLTRRRAKIISALRQMALNVLPAIGLLALGFYSLYLLPFLGNLLQQALAPAFVGGSVLLGLGALWSLLRTGVKAADVNPFKISLKDVLDPPNYEEKIGFIGRFEEDFTQIVSVTTQLASKAWEPQKLIIFIDDIDRCRLPQTVEIIEAMSLFLDSKQCIFIVGMDPAAIVTSIESKYKDLVRQMRRTTPGVVSPGSLFLDKIIQISFNLPRASNEDIDVLVDEIMHARDRGGSKQVGVNGNKTGSPGFVQAPDSAPAGGTTPLPTTTPPPSMEPQKINFDWDDLYTAITHASAYLKGNPRQVKRFINIFLLKVYIANRLEMLHGQDLRPLAVLIVWSMQWPEVSRVLLHDAHKVEVGDYLAKICSNLTDDGKWKMQASPQTSQEGQAGSVSHYEQALADLQERRKDERKHRSHWSHLPWEEWLQDSDFLACLKCLDGEQLWEQIKTHVEGVQPRKELLLAELMRL